MSEETTDKRSPLDDLAAEAAGLDAPPAGGTGSPGELQPAAPPPPGNFEALAFMLAAFREVAGAILKVKSLQRTLDDDNVERVARALAPVADKYGVQLGGMMGGPEAMAIMTAGPVLWTVYRELDKELKERRQAPEAPAAEPAAAPAAEPDAVKPGLSE